MVLKPFSSAQAHWAKHSEYSWAWVAVLIGGRRRS
jgi:hypothetical protein